LEGGCHGGWNKLAVGFEGRTEGRMNKEKVCGGDEEEGGIGTDV